MREKKRNDYCNFKGFKNHLKIYVIHMYFFFFFSKNYSVYLTYNILKKIKSKSLLEWDMSRVYDFVPWKSTTTKAKPRKQLCLTIGIYTNVVAYIYSQDTCVPCQF